MNVASALESEVPARRDHDRLLPSWRWSLVLLLVWLVPAVIFSGRNAVRQPDGDLALWGHNLVRNSWYWLYWAALCPAAYRMYVRWPLLRHFRWRSLAAHAGAAVLSVLLIALISAVVRIVFIRDLGPTAILAREFFSRAGLGLHLLHFFKYWFVLGLMALMCEVRLRREAERRTATLTLEASRLEGQLASATLQMLRSQLDPHFLFNALNSVSSLVESGDNERAFRMIGVLGGLLRATLEPRGEQRSSLARELELVDRYLELESLRFGDRLRVRIDVPPPCMATQLPSLLLQPLVENVVRHAVARQVDPVTLDLVARMEGGRLQIDIVDDGPGLPDDWSRRHSYGVGLSTTSERLRLVYGDDHRFEVGPSPDGGVRCRIDIPAALVRDEEPFDD